MNIHQVGLGFKANKWSVFGFGLLHPHTAGRNFWLYLVSVRTVLAWGAVIFTMLMDLGEKFESVSPLYWNYPVLVSQLSIFSLHMLQEELICVEYKQASAWSPPPFPAHTWLSTYHTNGAQWDKTGHFLLLCSLTGGDRNLPWGSRSISASRDSPVSISSTVKEADNELPPRTVKGKDANLRWKRTCQSTWQSQLIYKHLVRSLSSAGLCPSLANCVIDPPLLT